MKVTRSYVVGAWFCSLWLGGCSFYDVDGNGQRVEETREVGTFSRVRSDGDLDVDLAQGDTPSLVVSIDSNLQKLVETRVADDTLYIDLHENVGERVAGPQVRITVPELRAATLSGSGRMKLAFDQPEAPLDLSLDGSGALRFEGTAAAVGAALDGSGDLSLAGETRDVSLSVSGSGALHGRSMSAESGSLDLSGSGDLSATVTESVRLSLSGSGRIDVYGGAHVDGYKKSGSGDIVTH